MRCDFRGVRWLLFLAACLPAAVECRAQQHPIDFSKGTNLKTVYDSGLRPWRVRSDESGSLLVTDRKVKVVTPGSKTFELPVQTANFSVLAGNQLGVVALISQPMPINDALLKTQEISLALGVPVEGLEGVVADLTRFRDQAPARSWNGRARGAGGRYGVTLTSMVIPNMGTVYAKVDVSLDFTDYTRPMKFLTGPIKPPPGYENVSMEPPSPESRHRQRPFLRAGERGDDSPDEGPRQTAGASAALGSTSSPDSRELTRSPRNEQTGSRWSWLRLAACAFVVLAGVELFRRARK